MVQIKPTIADNYTYTKLIYIPYGSDKTDIADWAWVLAQKFISHMVQIKQSFACPR